MTIDVKCARCEREMQVFKVAYEKGIGVLCPACFWEQNKAIDVK